MTTTSNSIKIREFLSRISAFELLTTEQLDVLAKLISVRNLRNNQVLWLQGQRITFFTIVYRGQLRSVRRSSSGNEKLVSTLSPGLHFGLAEMITGVTSAVTIIADKDSTILTMDRKALKRELLWNADICYRLMQTMARAIFRLTRELERSSFENVHTRLARVLLRRTAAKDSLELGRNASRNISHEELAIKLGVSRETVSRALSDFKKKGFIETGYRAIKTIDADGLMQYVEDFDQW